MFGSYSSRITIIARHPRLPLSRQFSASYHALKLKTRDRPVARQKPSKLQEVKHQEVAGVANAGALESTKFKELSLHIKSRDRLTQTFLDENQPKTISSISAENFYQKSKSSSSYIDTNRTPNTQSKPVLGSKSKRNPSNMAPYREQKSQPSRASGGVPNPTAEYLSYSSESPRPVSYPRHLLVVIDLNGTLLYRPNRKQPTKFTARPHSERFVQYCVDTFTVVIWSSARQENVEPMCKTILTPALREKVVAIWGRETFNLAPEDFSKRVQCYKRLTKLWTDRRIAASHPNSAQGERWDQSNTVLIDDSSEKARSEPYNLIEIPEFSGDSKEVGDILPQVHDYLNFLSLHENVSAIIRAQPFAAQPGNPHEAVGLDLPVRSTGANMLIPSNNLPIEPAQPVVYGTSLKWPPKQPFVPNTSQPRAPGTNQQWPVTYRPWSQGTANR